MKNRYFQGQITSRPSEAETRLEAFTFFIIPPLATEGWMQGQIGVSLKLIRQHVDFTQIKSTPKKDLLKQAGAKDAVYLILKL